MIQDLGDTNKQIKAMFDNQVNEMIQNMRDEKKKDIDALSKKFKEQEKQWESYLSSLKEKLESDKSDDSSISTQITLKIRTLEQDYQNQLRDLQDKNKQLLQNEYQLQQTINRQKDQIDVL